MKKNRSTVNFKMVKHTNSECASTLAGSRPSNRQQTEPAPPLMAGTDKGSLVYPGSAGRQKAWGIKQEWQVGREKAKEALWENTQEKHLSWQGNLAYFTGL